jgi:hypothetical protein
VVVWEFIAVGRKSDHAISNAQTGIQKERSRLSFRTMIFLLGAFDSAALIRCESLRTIDGGGRELGRQPSTCTRQSNELRKTPGKPVAGLALGASRRLNSAISG